MWQQALCQHLSQVAQTSWWRRSGGEMPTMSRIVQNAQHAWYDDNAPHDAFFIWLIDWRKSSFRGTLKGIILNIFAALTRVPYQLLVDLSWPTPFCGLRKNPDQALAWGGGLLRLRGLPNICPQPHLDKGCNKTMLIFFLKSHQRIINRVSAAKVDIKTDFKESLVNRTIEKIKNAGCCNLLEIS